MKRHLPIFLLLWMTFSGLRGQADTLVLEVHIPAMSLEDFFSHVESQYPLRFYFQEAWVKDLRLREWQAPVTLGEVLEGTLDGQGLYYFTGKARSVIITRGQAIRELPRDLGNEGESDPRAVDTEPGNADPGPTLRKGTDEQAIIQLGKAGSVLPSQVIISGQVRDALSGEPIIGAVVYQEEGGKGVITNAQGEYLLSLDPGDHRIVFHSLGSQELVVHLLAFASGTVNVELEEKISSLKGVEVVARQSRNVTRLQMGMDRINLREVTEIPVAFGELDLFKVAQLLPGVQTVGEGASGFNVRGGSTGQNLFLLDRAPLFHTSHFFGFFSSVNSDVVSDFSLYKSGFPARYGNRLSSVFDISARSGSRKKFGLSGGISPVTGRLLVEGPLIREKASFLLAARSTYSDWLLKQVDIPAFQNSSAGFQDLNAKMDFDMGRQGSIQLSGYMSHDRFALGSDTSYTFWNACGSANYKYRFGDALVADLSLVYSQYSYSLNSLSEAATSFQLESRIRYMEGRADFSWYPNQANKIKFGLGLVSTRLDPGSLSPAGGESLVESVRMESEQGLEPFVYISNEFSISQRMLLYAGIRLSGMAVMGPGQVYQYQGDQPLEPRYIQDTLSYGAGEMIKGYLAPEPRLSLRYILGEHSSVKLSYTRMRQHIHMITNSTAISPTDYWKLSDSHIRPQTGDQFSLGYYFDLPGKGLESSAEVYYKKMDGVLEYKRGAQLLLNPALETDLVQGNGEAYGLELMLKKNGRLNGWVSYSYSRIFHTVDGTHPSEQINGGNPFPANYDKPHSVNLTATYKLSRRFALSTNFTFSTGRPITVPVSRYQQRGLVLLHYSSRNEFRIPNYVRWDLSATLFGNLRSDKFMHGELSLSVYNVTGRDNVYSIFFRSSDGVTRGYSLSIFSQPVISLSYNFRI